MLSLIEKSTGNCVDLVAGESGTWLIPNGEYVDQTRSKVTLSDKWLTIKSTTCSGDGDSIASRFDDEIIRTGGNSMSV